MNALYVLGVIIAGAIMIGAIVIATIGSLFTAIRKNQDAQVGIIDLEDGDF